MNLSDNHKEQIAEAIPKLEDVYDDMQKMTPGQTIRVKMGFMQGIDGSKFKYGPGHGKGIIDIIKL